MTAPVDMLEATELAGSGGYGDLDPAEILLEFAMLPQPPYLLAGLGLAIGILCGLTFSKLVQQRLDMQTFIYMSNFGKAIRRCGEVWLGMAREVYVESGRKMKGLGNQGQVESVELMRPIVNDEGELEHENDLSEAQFDVAVEVGPSSSSQRAATVRGLTQMMALSQDPEAQKVLQAAALMNMEGEGLSDIREYFRKQLVGMGVIKPTEQEAAAMAQAGQQQDPNAVFLQAAAEEALAKAAKARADVVKTVAESELTQAKTVETLAKVDSSEVSDTLSILEALAAQAPLNTPPRPVL